MPTNTMRAALFAGTGLALVLGTLGAARAQERGRSHGQRGERGPAEEPPAADPLADHLADQLRLRTTAVRHGRHPSLRQGSRQVWILS